MPDRWPFADDRSLAVVTLKRILDGGRPVLYVFHDDEGGWQFLDGDDITEEDASIVGLEVIVEHDPTLVEVAALPHGFFAYRESVDAPWQVGYHDDPAEE
ncbi:MAG: hypothetical protein JJU33_05455 [Phycisphaerales bacterium]|nr:hypothetical protein [Phycisphaerales bacterium]